MQKTAFVFAFFICSSIFTTAQKVSLDRFSKMKARSIGPAGMSGRVTSIDALHSKPDNILLGTASGGVWKY
jgi:hypothetical protein